MKLHDLAPKIAKKAKMRKGQGNGSKGTFAGRGVGGQNSRAGGGVRLGFEGGQSGVLARMPKKRGFNNPNRVEAQVLNLKDLQEVYKDGEKVVEKKAEKKTEKKAAKKPAKKTVTKK